MALVPRLRASGSAVVEQVEISAPILPRVSVLYPAEGARFPQTSAAVAALAHDAALTFDFLLGICSATHPGITVPVPNDLSPGASPRVTALPVDGTSTTHYESDLGLRCTRTIVVP